MIKQIFNIEHYWKVVVYYNIDYNFYCLIEDELLDISTPVGECMNIRRHLLTDAKACTISSNKYRTSIVLFNKHKTKSDYVNSIVHEAEHVKEAILNYYNVNNTGEAPAYTIGYIVSQMYSVYNTFV